jgi:L-lactate dehydrogenase complex protein LldG
MSARDRILAKLRATPIAAPLLPDVAAWFDSRRRHESVAERVARLRTALQAAHAEVHDTTRAGWPELLRTIAAAKGLRQLLIGADTPHGEVLNAALEAPLAAQPGPGPAPGLRLVRYEASVDAWRHELFEDIDAGLTLARSAIAQTGTLVLWPDAREPRLLSLVPPVHFVLLDTATIHADLHAAMVAENWKAGLPANVLLISGPSKTADIQQTLAYGAHGPKELIVLLIGAAAGAA